MSASLLPALAAIDPSLSSISAIAASNASQLLQIGSPSASASASQNGSTNSALAVASQSSALALPENVKAVTLDEVFAPQNAEFQKQVIIKLQLFFPSSAFSFPSILVLIAIGEGREPRARRHTCGSRSEEIPFTCAPALAQGGT